MDEFFTKPEVAQHCYDVFKKVMNDLDIDLRKYHYIEPSAGSGSFYNVLPKHRTVAIDINPQNRHVIMRDYFTYTPFSNDNIVIGNPPFGLRGKLALDFINHSYPFADVVAFILPQLFNSDGKGSTMKRVKGYKLAYTEYLDPNSFVLPNGEDIAIHTIFQVWTKINTHLIKIQPKQTCKDYIKVYSLSDGGTPASTRNKKMIGNCDLYLPSTCYNDMTIKHTFDELPHGRGYGIVIHKDREAITKILTENDWSKTAFYSTNSAMNLRTSLIEQVITSKGYCDE